MDKNTIIGLVLIGAILLLMPRFLPKQQPAPDSQEVIQQEQGGEAVQNPVLSQEPSRPAAAVTTFQPRTERAVVAGADTIIVETDLYVAALSNVGGGTVISWQLKEFLYGDKSLGIMVNLIPEVVSGNLGVRLEETNIDLSTVLFELAINTQYSENDIDFHKLQFVHTLADGGQFVKTYIFKDGTYNVDMNISFIGTNPQDYFIFWNACIEPSEKENKGNERYLEAFAMQGGELLKTKEKPTGFTEGYTDWTAVRNKYFMAAVIPISAKGTGAALGGEKIKRLNDKGKQFNWKEFTVQLGMRGNREEDQFVLYLGPIDYDILKSMNIGLEKIMSFGWALIKPISIAFFYVLQFLYGIIGNFGWSIVIFSIMIKVVLYPLTHKSYQSMQAMQELQPKMEAIKTKFKDNPQKINQETMKLYKKHGVNPMGGCLPMLLQMPVLFALFNLFRTTIMLRQAEFLGGLIPDLSAPDGIIGGTIHLLPILMGLTMIIQQRLTVRDPKQKAMAYMMPIMFSFIFYKMAAGLNLYYLMFNLLTIAQEMLIKKKKKAEAVE